MPLYHMGAQIGEKVPFWDSRDEFGDTCLLVLKPEEGRSLAKALGPYWLVLMRRHGATVAGEEPAPSWCSAPSTATATPSFNCMSKAQGMRSARSRPAKPRWRWDRNLEPRPQARAWEYWSVRLKKAGEYPAGAPKKASKKASRPAAKSSRRAPQQEQEAALARAESDQIESI